MISEEDKILLNNFFSKVNLFLDLFNNTDEKWKVLPTCNDYIADLYEIARKISFEDENFENIILDLEGMIATQTNDDSLLVRHKDFITKYS